MSKVHKPATRTVIPDVEKLVLTEAELKRYVAGISARVMMMVLSANEEIDATNANRIGIQHFGRVDN